MFAKQSVSYPTAREANGEEDGAGAYVIFGKYGKIVVLLAEPHGVQRHEQLLIDVMQYVWRYHLCAPSVTDTKP
jgi:hypothetical protein